MKICGPRSLKARNTVPSTSLGDWCSFQQRSWSPGVYFWSWTSEAQTRNPIPQPPLPKVLRSWGQRNTFANNCFRSPGFYSQSPTRSPSSFFSSCHLAQSSKPSGNCSNGVILSILSQCGRIISSVTQCHLPWCVPFFEFLKKSATANHGWGSPCTFSSFQIWLTCSPTVTLMRDPQRHSLVNFKSPPSIQDALDSHRCLWCDLKVHSHLFSWIACIFRCFGCNDFEGLIYLIWFRHFHKWPSRAGPTVQLSEETIVCCTCARPRCHCFGWTRWSFSCDLVEVDCTPGVCVCVCVTLCSQESPSHHTH